MCSKLGNVKRGKIKTAHRYVIYGPEGIGKSSLLASAPAPIVIDIEDGTGNLDIPRYMFRDEQAGHVPRTFTDVLDAITDLTDNEHSYKTLGIDTADRLESLIWQHMLARDSKSSALNKSGKALTSIVEYGYGKGYDMAVDEWRELCRRLDALRMSRAMDIVILAHAQIRNFKNPVGEDYDRYGLRINEKAAGWLREWSDVTGFACFEEGASKEVADDSRARGYSTGRRLLRFTRSAVADAKTRLLLPSEMTLDPINGWARIAAAVCASDEQTPEQIASAIAKELERFGSESIVEVAKAKTAEALAKGNRGALINYLNWLTRQQPTTTTTTTTTTERERETHE
jgi:hypothetical protein